MSLAPPVPTIEWTDEELAELAELTAPPSLIPYWMLANLAHS